MLERTCLLSLVVSFLSLLAPPAFATPPSPPPCTESDCASQCTSTAAFFADPLKQPQKPPTNGLAACIEVHLPSAADPCELEPHPACDCDAEVVPPGTQSSTTGLPFFAFRADAPAGTCVRNGELPNSCLIRAEEARCTIGGDGADCKAACDLLATRIDADTARSANVTVDGAACASSEACACVLELDGECTMNGEPVACGSSPKTAYEAWLAKERAKPSGLCEPGCSCGVPGQSLERGSLGGLLAGAAALAGIGVRRRRRAQR